MANPLVNHDLARGPQRRGHEVSGGRTSVEFRLGDIAHGSTILYHKIGHFTMLPNGQIAVSFVKPNLTCGWSSQTSGGGVWSRSRT